MNPTTLSDAELLARLHSLQVASHDILAKLLVVLGEVEERSLHLDAEVMRASFRRTGRPLTTRDVATPKNCNR